MEELKSLTTLTSPLSVHAGYILSVLHYHNSIVKQDVNLMIHLLEKGAKANHSPSLDCLGILYLNGSHTVKQDYKKALELLQACTTKEEGYGEETLASMYRRGLGVTQDLKYAIELMEKHIQLTQPHNTLKIHYLANILFEDNIDKNRALSLYEKEAAADGIHGILLPISFCSIGFE